MNKSLLEINPEVWREGMRNGFGLGEQKMDELRELYKAKALNLGMYYDDEAIVAIYKRGYEDASEGEV